MAPEVNTLYVSMYIHQGRRNWGCRGCHGTPCFSEGPKRSKGLLYKLEVGIMNLSHLRESFFLEIHIKDLSLGMGGGGGSKKYLAYHVSGGLTSIWHPLFWEPCYGPA